MRVEHGHDADLRLLYIAAFDETNSRDSAEYDAASLLLTSLPQLCSYILPHQSTLTRQEQLHHFKNYMRFLGPLDIVLLGITNVFFSLRP